MARFFLGLLILFVGGIAAVQFVTDLHDPQSSVVVSQPAPTPVATHASAAVGATDASGGIPGWIVLPALVIVGVCGAGAISAARRRRPVEAVAAPARAAARPSTGAGRYWHYLVDVKTERGWMQIARGYADFAAPSLAEVKAEMIRRAQEIQPGHQYKVDVTPATEQAYRLSVAEAARK